MEKNLEGMKLLKVFNELKLGDDVTLVTYITGKRAVLASGIIDDLFAVLGAVIFKAYVVSVDKYRDGGYTVVIDLEKEGG